MPGVAVLDASLISAYNLSPGTYFKLLQDFDVVLALQNTFALPEADLPIPARRVPLQCLAQLEIFSVELVQDISCPDRQDFLAQVEVHDREELLVEEPGQVVVVVVVAAAVAIVGQLWVADK